VNRITLNNKTLLCCKIYLNKAAAQINSRFLTNKSVRSNNTTNHPQIVYVAHKHTLMAAKQKTINTEMNQNLLNKKHNCCWVKHIHSTSFTHTITWKWNPMNISSRMTESDPKLLQDAINSVEFYHDWFYTHDHVYRHYLLSFSYSAHAIHTIRQHTEV